MKRDLNSILAIGAHPDDIEYGCLGFLLKQDPQVEKHIYVASLGSKGDVTSGEQRMLETLAAFESLSPTSLQIRKEIGIDPSQFNGIMDELYAIVEKTRPDLILCLGPHDTHQEHRYVHQIMVGAARRSRASILRYGILSNTLEFQPNFFVDVEDVLPRKKEILKAHASQAEKYYMQDEYLEIFHLNKYANLHGIRYCEAYEVERFFI